MTKNGLSATALKSIALASMLVDHAVKSFWLDAPMVCDIFGRLAFPLYAFLLTEGICHTRSLGRYALRLGIFAMISEVPLDLFLCGRTRLPSRQNVYFTLLLGLLAIWGFIEAEKRHLSVLGIGGMVLACLLADYLATDYEGKGVLCIILMYFGSRIPHKSLRICMYGIAILGIGLYKLLFGTWLQTCALLALPFIILYNGKQGRKVSSWLWYGIYPVHLLLFYFLERML